MRVSIQQLLPYWLCFACADAAAAVSPAFAPPPTPAAAAATSIRPRQWVACLSAPRSGADPARSREEFARRAAASGWVRIASLDEGLERAVDESAVARAATAPRPRTAVHPFDLDPARVLLIEAREELDMGAALAALGADPAVAWLEPNLARDACDFPADGSPPDDPLFADTRQWGLWNAGPAGAYRGLAGADIGSRAAWAISCGANEVRLAVADTGIDPGHPDLVRALADGRPRLVAARNVSSGAATAWADSNGHGTAVAGVMAALTHDGVHFDSLGMAGVCGGDGRGNAGCRLVPIKISPGSSGGSSSFEIARAILHATHAGARATNLSFAGGGGSRVERMAMYYAITRGCVVVAASGNRGHLGPGVLYPAAFAAHGLCLAVGASDARDRRAMFSSYGPALDLVAPGLDVWTTSLTYPNAFGARYPGYLAASGTSFAAPHVTGTIGLMAALRPDLSDTDFQHLLRASARDLGSAGRDDETGWGRLDAAAALRALTDSLGAPLALFHDERAAEVRSTGRLALLATVTDSFGTFDRGAEWRGRQAELFEATVRVTLPDSFADDAAVWPRVGGTLALRGDFNLAYWAPWAEVAGREGRNVTLRGYLYRVPMFAPAGIEFEPDSADYWLPLPPDQARIGFTVFGALRPPRRISAAPLEEARPRLRVSPNPARGAVRIEGPAGEPVVVFDVTGRIVQQLVLDAAGGGTWRRSAAGARRVEPGLYFVRDRAGRLAPRRLVVLD